MNSLQQKAMEKLLHGHGCASQLKLIIDHTESDHSSIEREDLAKSVLHCFSDALSILIDTNEQQDYQSNSSSSPQDSSPVLDSGKKPLHKRGRKTAMAESSEYLRHESPNPIYHDGFLWRKYGQKQIKESDHQRSYYKCAYTKDQNCEAKKQVQKIQENPPLYSTTYFALHTCQQNQAHNATFHIHNTDPEDHDGSHMIRFDQPNTNFSSSSSSHQHQHQNQDHIQDEYMTPVEERSPSQWMSSEVAHALEAFEFNPFWASNNLS